MNLLLYLFNLCLEKCDYPAAWKQSIIVPVYKKKGDIHDPKNYRGLSMIPCAAKIFSSILAKRLENWAESKKFFIETQNGFRGGRSCIDSIFLICTLFSKYCNDHDKRFYCAFIDFEKAFDLVDRNLLWKKMTSYGISTKAVHILRSMYSGLSACVRTSTNQLTESFSCNRGLRQGDSLSSVLFLFFINDLSDFFMQNDVKMLNLDRLRLMMIFLADDLSIFDQSVKGLQSKLNLLKNYCDLNRMEVNNTKTKVVVFRRRGVIRTDECWKYDGANIKVVDYYSYLGLNIYYNLKWTDSIAVLIRKAQRAMFLVSANLAKFGNISSAVKMRIFDSKVLSIALYGSELWGLEYVDYIDKFVDKFYKSILLLRPNASVNLARGELGRYSVKVNIYCRIIRYWAALISSPAECAKRYAYNTQMYLLSRNNNCWIANVREIMTQVGFLDIWDAQSMGTSVNTFIDIFRKKCIFMEKERWACNINSFSSMSLYAKIKGNNLRYERYLDYNISKKDMNLLTRLRGGLLRIQINIGRWENTDRENRICPICNSGVIEDEIHFLFDCRMWSGFRYYLRKYEFFRNRNICEVLKLDDIRFVKQLCTFLNLALEWRQEMLSMS